MRSFNDINSNNNNNNNNIIMIMLTEPLGTISS